MAKKPPTRATDLEQAIRTWTPDQLQCRDYGHNWRPHFAQRMGKNGFYEQIRCERCGMFRIRYLDRTGDVVGSQYKPPEGYAIKGLGHLTGSDRATIRIVSIMDHLGGTKEDFGHA